MDYDSYRKRFEQSNEAADLYTVWTFMSLHKSFWIKRKHVFEKIWFSDSTYSNGRTLL